MQKNTYKKSLRKQSLCRFYLRDFCANKINKCDLAHGIKDLNYQAYD